MAAIAGVDPWPLTLRELVKAAETKRRYDWDHTADLMALLATLKTGKQHDRERFHPLRESVVSPLQLDNPRAEYDRLMAQKGKR